MGRGRTAPGAGTGARSRQRVSVFRVCVGVSRKGTGSSHLRDQPVCGNIADSGPHSHDYGSVLVLLHLLVGTVRRVQYSLAPCLRTRARSLRPVSELRSNSGRQIQLWKARAGPPVKRGNCERERDTSGRHAEPSPRHTGHPHGPRGGEAYVAHLVGIYVNIENPVAIDTLDKEEDLFVGDRHTLPPNCSRHTLTNKCSSSSSPLFSSSSSSTQAAGNLDRLRSRRSVSAQQRWTARS